MSDKFKNIFKLKANDKKYLLPTKSFKLTEQLHKENKRNELKAILKQKINHY
jgi:hypothetical protein|tara:strand:+ start:441 stop:596 length:156 start_codon:yes stop_codon:yes gene_type:complete